MYPTQSGNPVDGSQFKFAIAVSNVSDNIAHLHVEGGGLSQPQLQDIAPGDVAIIELPWVQDLKMCPGNGPAECLRPLPHLEGALSIAGSYHLRSDQPITVYQFSPLNYQHSGHFSYSNDASLLMPTNAWTGHYLTAGWTATRGEESNSPSLIAVTAKENETHVTMTTKASTRAGGGAPGFEKDIPKTVTLHKGDVLQVAAYDEGDDLTGSIVKSDKPVQVIGGHFCANVPIGVTACDHLEESMLPVEALGEEMVIVPPVVPTLLNGKNQVVRIVATEADTIVDFEPPVTLPQMLNGPGEFIEFSLQNEKYVVRANKKIMAFQYMTGQNAGGGTGDPSLTQAVPIEQYRKDYLFHAPTNYDVNYVEVTGPLGTTVMIDGLDIGELIAIGESQMGSKRVELANLGNGNHVATGSDKFGITVYGYGQFTSYWYPGGMDLQEIVIE